MVRVAAANQFVIRANGVNGRERVRQQLTRDAAGAQPIVRLRATSKAYGDVSMVVGSRLNAAPADRASPSCGAFCV